MSRISLDFETRSRTDLKKVGHYKHAECSSTEVLVVAVREGLPEERRPVLTWNYRETSRTNPAIRLLRKAIEEGWEIHAWNAPFEWAILKNVCPRQFGFPTPDINNMRCTAAVARTAGCPPSLEKAGEFLKVELPKEKIGKSLIARFSSPLKGEFLDPSDPKEITVGGTKMSAYKAFDLFVAYCARDVEVESDIAVKLAPFALHGATLESFQFDMRMNDRGIPVHVEALKHAQTLIEQHALTISSQFREITGVNPTQNARVLEWMKSKGYKGAKLNEEERTKYGSDPSMKPEAVAAMKLLEELAYAAVKKVKAMLTCVSDDGFIRGIFLWCGAQKTWRWTSKKVQVQNLKKPSKRIRKFIEQAFQDVVNKIDLETFAFFYGNPYEILACLSRYFIRYKDEKILDSDFSSVEARILPKLIGCDRILQKFIDGEDPYLDAAESVRKFVPDADRDMGKTLTLACQFGGGWTAVSNATKGKLNEKQCRDAVKAVREVNPEFKPAWNACFEGFMKALKNPERWHDVMGTISFKYAKGAPFPRVMMRLPSGRSICYPKPVAHPITMIQVKTIRRGGAQTSKSDWKRVKGHVESEEALRVMGLRNSDTVCYEVTGNFQTHELTFYGHTKGVNYGDVRTYGGDLLQSCLAKGTLVVTSEGPKAIESITSEDLIWDGEEFVQCEGAIDKGVQECLTTCGVTATPDHLFMVDNCWISFYKLGHAKAASQSQEFVRAAIREFDSRGASGAHTAHELASSMRLRFGEICHSFGSSEVCAGPEKGRMQQNLPVQRVSLAPEARTELPSLESDPRLGAVEMLSPKECELPPLRCERHHGMQEVARGVHQLLQRHGRRVRQGASVGPHQQRGELHAEELPLGNLPGEREEQNEHSLYRVPVGEHLAERRLREIGGGIHNAPLPTLQKSSSRPALREAESVSQVYDILNCGPSSRFAVLSEAGILIAHNCTQGVGVDLLAHGCVKAERAGYEPFLVVHDQCLAPARKPLQGFIDALCSRPDWFHDFPLEADGDVALSYSKS
jgi:DNA polymerase